MAGLRFLRCNLESVNCCLLRMTGMGQREKEIERFIAREGSQAIDRLLNPGSLTEKVSAIWGVDSFAVSSCRAIQLPKRFIVSAGENRPVFP